MRVAKEELVMKIEVTKQEMKPVLTSIGNEVMFKKTGYGVKIAKMER